MLYFEEGVTYVWLHKGKERQRYIKDSPEESVAREDQWGDVRGAPLEVSNPYDTMTDDELRALGKEAKVIGWHTMKRDNLINHLKES